ncbi:hypothetical protein [Aldersonia kunmingensis]|uniref:hypothetical protein n=1 Tax=Aldersonia kunmingensis TaxID=408066 RepID=UPI000AAE3DC3|nr:hypothetical protein [Aldersonia kunmingensis]
MANHVGDSPRRQNGSSGINNRRAREGIRAKVFQRIAHAAGVHETAPPKRLRNATATRLHISRAGETVVFAPLERAKADASLPNWNWTPLVQRGVLINEDRRKAERRPGAPKTYLRSHVNAATVLCLIVISIAVPLVAWHLGFLQTVRPALTIAFVAVATMLPGLLFFMFDRQRLSTLRDRFERQIFRLDPNVHTLDDVESRYGMQMDEAFFAPDGKTTAVHATQRLWPVGIATSVLALGWVMAFEPIAADSDHSMFDALANPLAFAFLGSYFFAVNMCLRRYSRNDLRPKAYTTIAVRVIVVVVLAWLVQAIVGDSTIADYNSVLLPLAFAIGVLPETAMTVLRDNLRHIGLRGETRQLEEQLPLTRLEGLDLYDRSRLIDEGVPNIEALAHHDLVDLLLETRIPVGRLVDWVDQSVLYLHLIDSSLDEDSEGKRLRTELRRLGIRTATELVAAAGDRPHRRVLINVFGRTGDSPRAAASRLELFVGAVRDDEWMVYVQTWRDRTVVSDRSIVLDENGRVLSDATYPGTPTQ